MLRSDAGAWTELAETCDLPAAGAAVVTGDLRVLAARLAMLQAVKFGTRLASPRAVTTLARDAGGGFRVRLDDELDVLASAVVVASGVRYRRLGLPGLADCCVRDTARRPLLDTFLHGT
ncbi:NAD(P)/FAD-dependent oxidoreductase [Dactylosporangium cerinum]